MTTRRSIDHTEGFASWWHRGRPSDRCLIFWTYPEKGLTSGPPVRFLLRGFWTRRLLPDKGKLTKVRMPRVRP